MSQAPDSSNSNFTSQYVHLKEIEIVFKAKRPQRQMSLKLQADGDPRKSARFGKDEAVHWKDHLHVLSSAELIVSVYQYQASLRKTLFAEVSIKAADIAGKQSFSVEDSEGKVFVKLSCITVAPTEEFVELLIEEADHQLGNKKVLLDNLGKASRAVALLMDFGNQIADLHPAAKAAITIVNVLYERCKMQKECHTAASDLMKDLTAFLPFTQAVPPDLMKHENTKQTVKHLLEAFEQISILIINYSSKGVLGDLISFHEDEIDRSKDKLKRLKDQFDWCVKTEIWNASLRTVELAEDQLLSRLHHARNAYYSAEEACLKGTRQKLLDQVKYWASSDSKLFWLHGFAGSGKSAVANSVADMFHSQRLLLGCFFCHRDDPECHSPVSLIPTLAYHLSKWHREYRREVLSILQGGDEMRLAKDLDWQFDLLIRKPLISLGKSAEIPPEPLIIVIDALDECGDSVQSRIHLTRCIAKLADSAPWLKVFISSRPLSEIQQVLMQDTAIGHQSVNINTEIVDVDKDILQFTESCSSRLPKNHTSPFLTQKHLEALAFKASGLFIWTSTVFSFIADKPDPLEAVERFLQGDSDENPESKLNDLYTTVIHGASKGYLGNMPAIEAILGTIYVTSKNRPLPTAALADFLPGLPLGRQITNTTLEAVINDLQSVLYKDNNADDAVRVCHPSFLDFIGEKLHYKQFWVDSQQLDTCVATKCLQIMKSGLKFNICDLETSYLPDNAVADLKDRVSRCIPQSLQYSCLYWMIHISKSGLDLNVHVEIQNLVQDLLCKPIALFWLEALNLMKELKSSIDIVTQSSGFFKHHNEIMTASIDLYRFVSAFYEAIVISSPHLYISALSWVPSKSYMAKQFYHQFLNQPLISQGKHSAWKKTLWTVDTGSHVLCLAYSPDGRHIASALANRTLCIWDSQTGRSVMEPFIRHTKPVRSIAYSPNGKHIVSGSWDKIICVWDAQTGRLVSESLTRHTMPIVSVAYSPNGRHIIVGSWENTIQIWDAQTGKAVGEPISGHLGWVKTVIYSPDGSCIASGSNDKTICIWDTKTGKAVGEPFTGHQDYVNCIAYSLDGKHIVSGSKDKTICVWDVQSGRIIGKQFTGHSDEVLSVAYSPDGQYIISGSRDKTIRIWNAQTGEAVREPIIGHLGSINTVVYSPDGRHFISGSHDGTICIWDSSIEKTEGQEPTGHSEHITSVVYSPDGRHIASSSYDKTICIWDAQTGKAIGEPLTGHSESVSSVAYSPDARHIVSGSHDKTICIWDAQTGKAVGEPLTGHSDWIRSVAYSPDSRHIVSGSADKTICIWDAQTGKAVGTLTGHSSSVNSVAYSPDGRHIVSCSDHGIIYIWLVQTGKSQELVHDLDSITFIAYSPDGRHIVSSTSSSTTQPIKIWDAQTGKAIIELTNGTTNGFMSVAYSPDGMYIASGSAFGRILIWDAHTGKAVRKPLFGHLNSLSSVAYSPDGKHIASCSSDIRIWDIYTKKAVGELLTTHTNVVSPNNGKHVTCSDDNAVHICDEVVDSVDTHSSQQLKVSPDRWCRSSTGELLLWVPLEYHDRVNDMSEICISKLQPRQPPMIDWLKLTQYCGESWTQILNHNSLNG